MPHFGIDLVGRLLHDQDVRRRRRKPIVLGPRRRTVRRRRETFRRRLGREVRRSFFGAAPIGVTPLVVPLGGIGGGVAAAGRAIPKIPGFVKGALLTAGLFFAGKGFIGAGGPAKAAGRLEETGAAFASSPFAGLQTFFFGAKKFDPLQPIDPRLVSSFPINGIAATPDRGVSPIIGAGVGALGLAALLGLGRAVRRIRAPRVTTQITQAAPIGAVAEPVEAPVGAPALEAAVPDIKVQVRPVINVRASPKVHTEVLNILQSSSNP